MFFKNQLATNQKIPKRNKCCIEKNKSSPDLLLRRILGDRDDPFSGIFYIECMNRQKNVPPADFKNPWAEYGLILCMNKRRNGRKEKQKDEDMKYFFWHGAPPDDMMIFKTFSILQKCL